MATKYRQGKKEDCKSIAEMIDIASDGVVEYLFHDLVPEMSAVEVVAHDLEYDNYLAGGQPLESIYDKAFDGRS